MSKPLTREMIDKALPKNVSLRMTDSMLTEINAVVDDPGLRENFRDNLVGFVGILKDGKYSLEAYVNAVKYCSFKLLGDTNIGAYTKTFPDRYQRMLTEGAEERHIHSVCSAYNRTILVNKIIEQSLVPSHILNAEYYQRALNKQVNLMDNPDVSFKVQTDAANSLLTHLKPPEISKIELDVNVREDKSILELQDTIRALALKQKQLIEGGTMTVTQVAHSKLLISSQDNEDFDNAKEVG